MLGKELVIYRDKLYWVYKRVKQDHIKEGFVNDVKDFWKCDLVVKNKQVDAESLIFLKEIPEAELVD